MLAFILPVSLIGGAIATALSIGLFLLYRRQETTARQLSEFQRLSADYRERNNALHINASSIHIKVAEAVTKIQEIEEGLVQLRQAQSLLSLPEVCPCSEQTELVLGELTTAIKTAESHIDNLAAVVWEEKGKIREAAKGIENIKTAAATVLYNVAQDIEDVESKMDFCLTSIQKIQSHESPTVFSRIFK